MVFYCEDICFRCSYNCKRWGEICNKMSYKYFFLMLLFTLTYISGLVFMVLYLMKYIEMDNIWALIISAILIFGSALCCFYINNILTFDHGDNVLSDGEDNLSNV